jgi:hypothetical protein
MAFNTVQLVLNSVRYNNYYAHKCSVHANTIYMSAGHELVNSSAALTTLLYFEVCASSASAVVLCETGVPHTRHSTAH